MIDDIHDGVEDADLTVLERQVSELTDLAEIAGHGPVVRLVNWLIHDAVEDGASDIHVEPGDRDLRVRFRIDGRLHEKIRPPHRMGPAITSRIKIMAELDIAERRLPQDGDIHVLLDGRRVDLRVSTMSGRQGEKVVIRIIDSRNAIVAPERLGMAPEIRDRVVGSAGRGQWRRPGDRSHRKRQEHHAVFGVGCDGRRHAQPLDDRGPG